MNSKYYVDIERNGFNKDAYLQAFKFAIKVVKQNKDVNRIVCYVHTKCNIGYFEPFFNDRLIKNLLNGNMSVEPFPVPLTIETKNTYSKSKYSSSNRDLVLAFGMDLEDLEVLDDYYGVKCIVAIPWLKDKTMPWVKRWNAEEITGKKEEKTDAGVSEVVKVALAELTSSINLSTGIVNPFDNSLAKTYIRALHKYESELKAEAVVSYLIAELGWTSTHANDVGKLITTLNQGRFFRGGDKTGLQVHYKHWKEKANLKK